MPAIFLLALSSSIICLWCAAAPAASLPQSRNLSRSRAVPDRLMPIICIGLSVWIHPDGGLSGGDLALATTGIVEGPAAVVGCTV